MAEKRMFTKKITESDSFLDMPSSTQALYFHLNMAADDDGFVNNPRKIQRDVGASADDLNLLLVKSFIISFDSGIIVIKHWKMHNYIQSDRYKPTDYTEEKSMLSIKENKSYTLTNSEMDTKCIQNVSVGKVSIGKNRLGKVSKVKESKENTLGAKNAPYYNDESLNQAFTDFVDMRKKIKKPLTDRAIEMQKKKLKELSCLPFSETMDTDLAIKILNQSTMNSWLGLFPLKENQQKGNGGQAIDWDNV
jgi:hypothetical protein